MKKLPKLIRVQTEQELNDYAQAYEQASGLPVPLDYLRANKTFAVKWNGQMIGGFILGMGPSFRTLDFFVQKHNQAALLQQMRNPKNFTEITCFWLSKNHRSNSLINLLTWAKLAFAIKKHSNKYLLYGTNSKGLARLYNTSRESFLIHQDQCQQKQTFVFMARTQYCIKGILEIMWFKLRRIILREQKRSFTKNFQLKVLHRIPFAL